jgi:dipeptidyl aminopeptidase/acylaminoacyl peptidase
LWALVVWALAHASVAAGQTSPAPSQASASRATPAPAAGMPPLLDRELFFGNPEISGAVLSPDGKRIAFLKPWKDTRNIYVKDVKAPFDQARLVTTEAKRPISGFFWTRDSRLVLYVKDNDGDENFNVWAVDPSAAAAPGSEAPPSRNLTDAKGVRALIYSVPKKDPDTIYIGLNDRDAAWHDVYRVKISTGQRELLRKNTEKIAGWMFDLEGRLRLATRVADNGDTEVLRLDPDGMTKVYSCSVFETCGPTRFHKDGRRVYMETNKGQADLTQLVLFDPATGTEEPVESDPMKRVDFGGAVFAESTDELVATAYEDERTRVYFRDKAWENDHKFLKAKFPRHDISLGSTTDDDRIWNIVVSNDVDPGERYIFDRDSRALTLQYKSRERIPREHMAEMKPVRYPSSDGLEIPAFLTLPKGVPAKNLPTIILPHGGPWARDSWGFDNLAQFLANRGYAAAAQLPGVHRVREEVPERRQPAVGREDAGRHHLGRQVPRGSGHRRPEARGHHGRFVWRVRDPRRRRVHARRLCRRRLHRRPVEPDHPARVDPAVLGGGSQAVPRADG